MTPIKDQDSNSTDVKALLTLLSCCGELSLDSKALAAAFGIARTDHATRKIKIVFAKYDYQYENGEVTKIDDDNDNPEGNLTFGTSKTIPSKRKKDTVTPIPKNKKLKQGNYSKQEGKETTELVEEGEVRTETKTQADKAI